MKIPRWLRLTGIWLLGIIIVLVSLYALFYAWVSWSAKRDWAQTKKELEARGEKLSLVDFVPLQIPDGLNFFCTPLFEDLFKERDAGSKYRIDELISGKFFSGIKNPTNSEGLRNLSAYAESLRTEDNKNQSAADVLLNECEKRSVLWDELYQAAERPGARSPLQYEKAFAVSLTHLSKLMKLCQLLQIRAIAYMEAGKSTEAERDVHLLFRISDAISAEPFLISQLIRRSCLAITVATIWEGIERHSWTSDQLAHFENQLSSEKLADSLSLAWRGERGNFNTTLIQVASNKRKAGKILLELSDDPNSKSISKSERSFWWSIFVPWDWAYGNMAFYSREIQRRIDALGYANEYGINDRITPKLPQFLSQSRVAELIRHIRYLFVWLALSASESAFRNFSQTQAQVDMARIVCALERYKIAKGTYPENLSELVPDYIQKLPNDIANAKPYHYRRNALDKFTLWSVGFDGVDDNATVVTKANPEKGDWVWGIFGKK